jgi:hypothetical protein
VPLPVSDRLQGVHRYGDKYIKSNITVARLLEDLTLTYSDA